MLLKAVRNVRAIRTYAKNFKPAYVQTVPFAAALKIQPVNYSLNLTNTRYIHVSKIARGAQQPFTIKTVRERIMLVLSLYDKIDPTKLTFDSNFFSDLGLDSLDFVEVIMAIEDEFMFEIPDGDSDRLKTPRDIFQYVCDRQDVYH